VPITIGDLLLPDEPLPLLLLLLLLHAARTTAAVAAAAARDKNRVPWGFIRSSFQFRNFLWANASSSLRAEARPAKARLTA
jgi:hypothetical protein